MLFNKKKKDINEIDEKNTLDDDLKQVEDLSIEDKEDKVLDDNDLLPEEIEEKEEEQKKEEKAKEKAEAKKEKKERRKETGVVATFNMYKFIIKILIFAILLVFGILMFIYKDELIGAVYMVAGIVITFATLIRIIPLVKTTKSHKAKVVMIIQLSIHFVIGLYLILAAVIHWDKLKDITQAIIDGKVSQDAPLMEQLNAVSGGWFAKFNISAFIYILVIYFYTLAVGYYWVTILYGEKTRPSLFWIQTVCISLAVLLGCLSKTLNAQTLIITLAIIALIGALVVGGEAGGGYFMYRRKLAQFKPKEKKNDKKKEDKIETPAKDEDKKIDEIDPNIIPVNDDDRDSSIVS